MTSPISSAGGLVQMVQYDRDIDPDVRPDQPYIHRDTSGGGEADKRESQPQCCLRRCGTSKLTISSSRATRSSPNASAQNIALP